MATLLNRIYDKQLSIYTGYLVFFDDVCMNKYTLSYSTNTGVSLGSGTATVTLLYTPAFADMPSIDTVNQTVENGICMRIFAENMFTRKYVLVFDGIIKQKVLGRSAGDATVSFTAVDYIYWMQRIVAPIAIPLHDAIAPGERLKWKAQSVDPATTAKAETTEAGRLKGKKVQEFFDILKSKTFENSKTYSDPNTVANFDAAADRVEIMGDISEELVKHEVIDFVVDTNATFADTMFVTMNNVTSNLLLEFYQDRDGIIRLKPPFWNEGVLRSHVIDPLMIVNAQEQTNWLNFYTRVIMTGGTEEWAQNDSKVDFLTPVGVYVGNLSDKSRARWTDYTSEGDTGSSYGGYIPKNGSSGGGAGGKISLDIDTVTKQIAYNRSARTESIKYIVVHDTGNKASGANAESHYNYFNGCNRNTSADIFVDDHSAWYVNDYTTYYTWHCGDGNGKYGITNGNSVGIEMCINCDGVYETAMQNTVKVVRALMQELNIPIDRVVRHYDASRKNCPATMSGNHWERWNNFVAMLKD